MNISASPPEAAVIPLRGVKLTRPRDFDHLKASYHRQANAEEVAAYEKQLPRRIARIKPELLRKLKNGQHYDLSCNINIVCKKGEILKEDWVRAADQVFNALREFNPKADPEALKAHADQLMEAAGGILAADRKLFEERMYIDLLFAQDNVSHNNVVTEGWHPDSKGKKNRGYLMRTALPAEYLLQIRGNFINGLLEIAKNRLRPAEFEKWQRQHEKPYEEKDKWNRQQRFATRLARRLRLIYQPKNGEIVLTSNFTWHRSFRPSRRAKPRRSLLIRVDVMPRSVPVA